MISLTPALGLMCLIFSAASTVAAPVSQSQLAERNSNFNPRQKWQVNEINCVQILNPAPGATYHPGYFVRMIYGTGQCDGATAAGPWSIHLYNNPEIQGGGKIRYDYHEVIADGINESRTQFVWNIPSDQDTRARNVRKPWEYYVRVETSSSDGVKLVGNAGPFAINPDTWANRAQAMAAEIAKPIVDLKRRDNENSDFDANFALIHRPVEQVPTSPAVTTAPAVPTAPVVDPAPTAPAAPTVTVPPVEVAPPATSPVQPVDVPGKDTAGVLPPAVDGLVPTPTGPNPYDVVPTPHNLPPFNETVPGVPLTPIPHTSIIPSKAIVVGAITAGALALGYGGGALFGTIGAGVGAVLGGVVGGLAVLGHYIGLPV
ncbi:hypothetical protein BGZ94_001153 [Podila epigama]|nr:hypothetical protein BGZ94_001153 [Podila epigama]